MATATATAEPCVVDDDDVTGAGVGSVGETSELGISPDILGDVLCKEDNDGDAIEGSIERRMRHAVQVCHVAVVVVVVGGGRSGGGGGVYADADGGGGIFGILRRNSYVI